MMRLANALLPSHRRQRGQILVMVAAGMVVFLGFVALSTDVGMYVRNLRHAQNDADAAALAGAQELMTNPPGNAQAKCEEWVTLNAPGSNVTCTVGDYDADGNPDVTAEVQRSQSTAFARVLGINSLPVDRKATAEVVHAAGGPVCPWALGPDPSQLSDLDASDGTYLGIEIGKIYVVKESSGGGQQGNFGVLKLYQTGADYKEALGLGCGKQVSKAVLEGTTVTADTDPGNIGANTTKCLGNPKNPGQPCTSELNGYFNYELSDLIHDDQKFDWCDVPMNWNATTGIGTPTGYDPATQGARAGCGRDAANGGNGRYLLVPIVCDPTLPNGLCVPNGSSPTEILGIAAVYVTGWGTWDAAKQVYDRSGGQAAVYVQFLDQAPFNPRDLVGESNNPLAPLRIMLIR
jgi:Flp pilus assembly protein TadG